ncbi:MAG: FAD-binding oxidoreductase [Planctomycetota bacterium]
MNEIAPERVEPDPDYRRVRGWERVREAYAQYLEDESRMQAARVEAVHFPATTAQVAAAVRAAREAGHRVAVSGARTGIAGAAVPLEAEEVIALEQVKHKPVVRRDEDGGWVASVGAGTTLEELGDALTHGLCEYPDGRPDEPLFYPIDATETSAHLGGTIATNASGARTLYYGPTRDHVRAVTVVTADGRLLRLRRDRVRADGAFAYRSEGGEAIEVPVADLPIPDTKHTAGYHLKPGMDAVDLFVGSEGTLGIVVGAELRLSHRPANRLFLTQFVDGEGAAVEVVGACKAHADLSPLALEYIGPRALDLLRSQGRQTPAYMEVSRLPETARAALYVELPFADEAELDRIYEAVKEVLAARGLSAEDSWAGFGERDLTEMKRLRHAVPESVNTIIGRRKRDVPELHKVGTDMAVPDEGLAPMMEFYRARLAECGLDYVIFGHIGSGHVHVNILPETVEELVEAEDLYTEFAREAVRLGGSVAAEHGIGRIKKAFLPVQYDAPQIDAMRRVKGALDPEGILNPGVLFD